MENVEIKSRNSALSLASLSSSDTIGHFHSSSKSLNCSYFERLGSAVGWKYLVYLFLIYGVNQGMGESYTDVATNFFFSDPQPKGINIDAQYAQKLLSFANVPWQAKSVYGILSDLYPLCGYKRVSYIGIAAIVGLISGACLSFFHSSLPPWAVGVALFFTSFSIASPDVMIDASVAEKCQDMPHLAADLQSFLWGSLSIGAILASSTASFVYANFTSSGLFFVVALTAFAMIIPSLFNWLNETSQQYEEYIEISQDLSKMREKKPDEPDINKHNQNLVIRLTVWFLFLTIALGTLAELDLNTKFLVLTAFLVAVFLCYQIYNCQKEISPVLAKASLYIFLVGAVQPNSVIISYWMRDVYDHCKGETRDISISPCFSSTFLANLSIVSNVGLLLGTIIYNRSFATVSYHKIYFWTQSLLVLAGLMDCILVLRLNLVLGIPDEYFMLGDEAMSDVIKRLNTMPVFILSASLCPKGIEATLFAFTMGISNFGVITGGYFGLGLVEFLGVSKDNGFHNIEAFVLIRSVCKAIPLLMISTLLPKGSPGDELLGKD